MQDAQNYLDNFKGEKNQDFKRYKISFALLSGKIDQALNDLAASLNQTPESAEFYFEAVSLLFELQNNNKLNAEQQLKLQQLPIVDSFKRRMTDFFALLQGNPTPYIESHGLTDASPDTFIHKIDTNLTEPFLYAAILKRQGNNHYAEALSPAFKAVLQRCQAVNNTAHWVCLLFIYLDGNYQNEPLFSQFQRSLQMLDDSSIGFEKFILTSPVYYGVNQDPEFEKVAQDFLDRTFRKWNPDLVAEITSE